MNDTKVWYITGASKGMGRAIAKQLLLKGHKVAATSRTLAALEPLAAASGSIPASAPLATASRTLASLDPLAAASEHIPASAPLAAASGSIPASAPLAAFGDRFLPLEVDLTSESSIAKSIEQTVAHFGSLDVVINNAGYGLGGALEELTAGEIADNFDVNFFSVVRVVQQALPYMRKQRSGNIINISSIAGFAPGLGWTMYCAAKFAVSGLTEALANDLGPLGIKVTNVLPGWFRTNFAKPDSIAYGVNKMDDYAFLREYHEKMNSMDGHQLGDPDKIADAFLELVNSERPPTNLFLGTDAFNRAKSRIEELNRQMETWKEISFSTDHSS